MYHGFQDYTLFSTYAPAEAYGNINNPIAIPSSSGIPKALNDLIITLPFNNFEVLDKSLETSRDMKLLQLSASLVWVIALQSSRYQVSLNLCVKNALSTGSFLSLMK